MKIAGKRRFLNLGLGLGLIAAGISIFALQWTILNTPPPKPPPSPLIGTRIPQFTLPLLDAPQQSFDSNRMLGAPYLINVWGTWCRACKYEHPEVLRLARSKRIRIVGYNWQDEPAQALAWLRTQGNPYLHVVMDQTGETAGKLKIRGTPHHILVDGAGIIRWKRTGILDRRTIEDELLPALASIEQAP
jgi:cytochrome c biogenesis protein CcmG/thiol:disulfide interchange protein DsbE